MRGTLPRHVAQLESRGIIPAHAGNTFYPESVFQVFRDHPRTCGEHLPTASVFHPLTGSSPHMRGTLQCRVASEGESGIIPAHAGNTASTVSRSTMSRDHPRTCGEHMMTNFSRIVNQGSSPHMRGTRLKTATCVTPLGIIPAHAGNTGVNVQAIGYDRDHPRTCGEHLQACRYHRTPRGSSPHMRGTRTRHQARRKWYGIIPAHAGNTRQR